MCTCTHSTSKDGSIGRNCVDLLTWKKEHRQELGKNRVLPASISEKHKDNR
jgi:hypothetical protein